MINFVVFWVVSSVVHKNISFVAFLVVSSAVNKNITKYYWGLLGGLFATMLVKKTSVLWSFGWYLL